ncbi:MAG: bifunctional nuclease family protein [Microscillaceae bacterium]|nr:bifunctional nuclease family protein [Microscillaceae bacterium]MDW8459773.1 bifunctional nuclease family protein [Cytophagales bacterium]
MNKVRLKIIGLSSSQAQSTSFALILGEQYGVRRLPIVIGICEAQAIAIEIERITPNRPMTHDLFKSFAAEIGFTVLETTIVDLREGIFYAEILCRDKENRQIVIDARPSDAIAIALRFNAPIYAEEKVMSEASITITDEEMEGNDFDSSPEERQEVRETVKKKTGTLSWEDYSSEELQRLLNEALENEQYERAAQIRDELNRRN